jgi:5-methylcytosine-specific restriction endonuclease McrA
MTDDQLLEHMRSLLKREAALDLEMIDCLREIHRRKLYLAHGSPNFHAFCTDVLGMSSDSAWRRMKAASLADRFPEVVKPLIAEGRVHLTGLALLDKVVTRENGERLIQEAVGKTTTEIKAIIAREQPETCAAGVRKLPPRQLSQDSWRFQATMDAATKALLTEVQDIADEDDCNVILREALAAYRDALRVKKQNALKRPSEAEGQARNAATRAEGQARDAASKADGHGRDAASMRRAHDPNDPRIPRWMEREVRERDGHQCTFVGHGGRCPARRDLQVHHITAVALGGKTVLANLTLHCGSHNRYQAELDLGVSWANSWRKCRDIDLRVQVHERGPPGKKVGTM